MPLTVELSSPPYIFLCHFFLRLQGEESLSLVTIWCLFFYGCLRRPEEGVTGLELRDFFFFFSGNVYTTAAREGPSL